MYGASDEIKLCDFGFEVTKLECGKEEIGGDMFSAPEGKFGEKCDVWSLGCLLYYILTGQIPPFGEGSEESNS